MSELTDKTIVKDMAVSGKSRSMVVMRAMPCWPWRRARFRKARVWFFIIGSSIARSAIVHAEIAWIDDQGQGFNLVVAAVEAIGEFRDGPLVGRRTANHG